VWVDKIATSWSKMIGNSVARVVHVLSQKEGGIVANMDSLSVLDRANPKLGFKCVLDSR